MLYLVVTKKKFQGGCGGQQKDGKFVNPFLRWKKTNRRQISSFGGYLSYSCSRVEVELKLEKYEYNSVGSATQNGGGGVGIFE